MLETTTSFAGSGRRAITQRDLSPLPGGPAGSPERLPGTIVERESHPRHRGPGRAPHVRVVTRATPAPGAPST
ncbi:hypothetical protein HMPREF9154_2638 [Arachnia propionica F0230a]|nr:hypothetical protein HMPREF9154_2638 [Arachnia propionica F0230a]